MQPESPERREDWFEHDLQQRALQPACQQAGIDLQTVLWDRDDWSPEDFKAVVIGTVWDYTNRPQEFLARLAEIAERTLLLNSLRSVLWNYDKHYLQDLERAGIPVVPTHWADSAAFALVQPAFDAFQTDELVVKPVVGAGAWRQARVRRDRAWPESQALPPGACMVQPYLPAVASEGEFSLIYFGKEFSHCALKRPKTGDYRVQSMFGATEIAHVPPAADLALAQRILNEIADPPLYARVDLVRSLNGELALMELELIEPYLYPEQGPGMGERFSQALLDRINGPQ